MKSKLITTKLACGHHLPPLTLLRITISLQMRMFLLYKFAVWVCAVTKRGGVDLEERSPERCSLGMVFQHGKLIL